MKGLLRVGLIGCGLMAVILLIGHVGMARIVQWQVGKNLRSAQKITEEFQRSQIQELSAKAQAVVQIPSIRAAVATPGLDHGTILRMAQWARKVIGTDFLIFGDAQGMLLASVTEPDRSDGDLASRPGVAEALQGNSSGGIWSSGSGVYQTAAIPVYSSGRVAGVCVVGVPLDESMIERLEAVTGCRVALLGFGRLQAANSMQPLLRSLQEELNRFWAGMIRFRAVGGKGYGFLVFPLGSDRLQAVLFQPLDEEAAALGWIRFAFLLMGASVIPLLLTGWKLSLKQQQEKAASSGGLRSPVVFQKGSESAPKPPVPPAPKSEAEREIEQVRQMNKKLIADQDRLLEMVSQLQKSLDEAKRTTVTTASLEGKPPLVRKSKGRILLIDDNISFCEIMKINLERVGGYEVTAVYSGREGLEAAQSHIFDVVITDFKMPDMNGDKVLEKLKAMKPDLPVLLFSIFYDLNDPITPEIKGKADGLLPKPVDHEHLYKSIEAAIAKKALGR